MKKSFFLLCLVLFLLGSVLPLAGYNLAKAVSNQHSVDVSSSASSEDSALLSPDAVPSTAVYSDDAEIFLIADQSTGEVQQVSRRNYILGAVAAEMPIDWPDEALKAQAIAAHSYALYCRDHSSAESGAWLSADPARRQGYLTDAVLRSYWGTNYESNYARLSALVDSVLTQVLCYDDTAAGTSYFAISNGRTEASENVWGTPLPYLIAVDSESDRTADNYEVTLSLTAAQVQSSLFALGLTPDLAQAEHWFGAPEHTPSGYVSSLLVCGQRVTGTALRRALGLRSTDFTFSYSNGTFTITTHGYGHGVGLSQWGAKTMAEQGNLCAEILAHYFPGTILCNQ